MFTALPHFKTLLYLPSVYGDFQGGQVVRMAMSLSCLLQKHISIINIRAGRSSPGLKPQHLAGMSLARGPISEM